MAKPREFLSSVISSTSSVAFFFFLCILGIIKGALMTPIITAIVLIGNTAVTVGLWPAHFIWTHYCVLKTKWFGPTLKIILLVTLTLPLVLWPIFVAGFSALAGVGYGFFAPLLSTFEIVGEGLTDKRVHSFVGGCWSTILGSCTVVRDFTDFSFHSFFSYTDELNVKVVEDQEPLDINILKLPSCAFVVLLALPLDMLMITAVALWKSPFMMFKGWKRLFEDAMRGKGPFTDRFCILFAVIAIILWPVAVALSVVMSILSSFILGLQSGFVTYQENSIKMGLSYSVAIISRFDEYTNDLLYLREGSCFPRPKHSKGTFTTSEGSETSPSNQSDDMKLSVRIDDGKLVSERSKALRKTVHHLRPIQIWDWLFQSCEVNGRMLLRQSLISVADLENCFLRGRCKELIIKLPACTILQFLIKSSKSDSTGLFMYDDTNVNTTNWPEDRLLKWFVGPLLIIQEQIKSLELNETEESCLIKLIMTSKNDNPEDWDNTFPSDDNVRKAQLQAIFRRLQGIVSSFSRMPTFRRRFMHLMKTLYEEEREYVSRRRYPSCNVINGADGSRNEAGLFDNDSTWSSST